MRNALLLIGIVALPLLPASTPIVDWPARVQKPYEKIPLQQLGLTPVLVDERGQTAATPANWEGRRRELVELWTRHVGKPPPRSAHLEVRVEAIETLADHTRRLVSFSTEGSDRLRAYLLTPPRTEGGKPWPAVVVFHQTSAETLKEPVGLGSQPDLALALELVRRGFVTLSPECYIMKDGGPRAQAEALERRRPGWTGLGKMTFDASRCIDFLETVPEVDARRIGCIGHSLGAKEVLYAMAFEPRYKAGVFSEGGIGLRMSNWIDPWYLTERMKPNIPRMENHQVLSLIAPRPFLLIAGDSADGDASWTFIKAAQPVYELLGAGDRIGMHNHHRGHAFPVESRVLSYQWLESWLR